MYKVLAPKQKKPKQKKNKVINDFFPKFKDKVISKKTGVMGMFSMTEELNEKTQKYDKILSKVFKDNKYPLITYILIGINILIFLLSIFNSSFIINVFANYYLNIQNGEIWRLITSTFVHVDIFHISFNMMALYAVGPLIEKYYGKTKYLIIYLENTLLYSKLSNVKLLLFLISVHVAPLSLLN